MTGSTSTPVLERPLAEEIFQSDPFRDVGRSQRNTSATPLTGILAMATNAPAHALKNGDRHTRHLVVLASTPSTSVLLRSGKVASLAREVHSSFAFMNGR